MAHHNSISIPLSISSEQIITAVKKMKKAQQQALLEDLIAAINPEYLESIKEARRDYVKGLVYTHEEVFGEE